jgi:hypothetical protein
MWFDCVSAHGTRLVTAEDGRLCHAVPEHGRRVHLFLPKPNSPRGFLVATDAAFRFFVPPSPYSATALPVLLKEQVGAAQIILLTERCFLTAEEGYGGEECQIVATRRTALAWEQFALDKVPFEDVSSADSLFGMSIIKLLNLQNDPPSFKAALVDRLDWLAFEGILPCLNQVSKRSLARLLIEDPISLAAMADVHKGDPWSSIAAPQLARWVAGHAEAFPRISHIGPELDWLGHRYLPEKRRGIRPVSAVEVMVREVRETAVPRRRACILATARNEGVYYLEWIAYHRSIGFEDFFIYTNDNDDFSAPLLDALAAAGIINVVYSSLGALQNAQAKAYGHALGFNARILDYEWTMVCDLDEFLFLDKDYFTSVSEFLAWHEVSDVDCISLSWSHINASGQKRWDERPMIDRFATRRFWLDTKVKSIFRTTRAAQSYAHFPAELDGARLIYRNAVGDIRITFVSEEEHGIHGRHLDDDPEYRFGSIVHYYWKSAEEFLWKHSRNKGDHARIEGRSVDLIHPAEIAYYVDHFGERPAAQLTSEVRSFATSFDREIAYLRSLPGVAEAAEVIRQNFMATIERLKREFLGSNALLEMGEQGRQFALLLRD